MPTEHAFQISWVQSAQEMASASAFLSRLMPQDNAYISHSEIQWGLSQDGQNWAEGAHADLERYFAQFCKDGGQMAQALDAGGTLLGAAAVEWNMHTRTRFAIVQDLIVSPAARNLGLGASLMHFIEAEAKMRDMAWVFLESGVRNHRAHAFFTRAGYGPVSHSFAKCLKPPQA